MTDKLPILLYGATGYTGALIAKELDRRGARFGIAGRDRQKLEALQATLHTRPEILTASVDAPAALSRIAARARVVLSCAGPFVDYGLQVQEAALAAGAHFLDITGEAPYMLQTWRENDARARAKGVAIINAVGFDVVASDLPAWLASQGLEPVERLELAIHNVGSPSQGTMRSALRGTLGESMGYEDGVYREVPPGAFRRQVDFPPPIGRAWALSLPWGDIATAPRSTGARTVRIYFRAPRLATRIAPHVAPLAKVARWKPVNELLQRRIAGGPAGPSEAQRARSSFVVWAEATSMDGRRQVVTLSGPGGYTFTAVSASECALRVAAPDFDRVGVLTPSQAFDVPSLLEALRPHGVEVTRQV